MVVLALLLNSALVIAAPIQSTSLNAFLDQLSSSFIDDPLRFQQLVGGPTVFDRTEIKGSGRSFGQPKILDLNEKAGTATLLLSAAPTAEALDNSGDRTEISSEWSGIYPAVRGLSGWTLGSRMPFGINRIVAQDIDVQLDPRGGLLVHDGITVEVASKIGFVTMLNASAHLARVTEHGKPVPFDFQNGLLWLNLPRGRQIVSLNYDMRIDGPEKRNNSAAFGPHAGHVRNEYFWHPFFGFSEERSRADFKISATIPAQYHLALDIPQSERIEGDHRIVNGVTRVPTAALTLAYDDSWDPRILRSDGVELTLFTKADFMPSRSEIGQTFDDAIRVLTVRFGPPPIKQVKIVQARQRQGGGWHFLSNQAIFAGTQGGPPARSVGYPVRAFLGHEISHLWTHPTGPATNFLMEGWATYAESLLLQHEYGPDVAEQFWRDEARIYATTPEAQSTALDEDSRNTGVSYSKGAWLLRMIEELVSTPTFNAAIRTFASAPPNRATYDDFLSAFGDKKPMVERFSQPWYTQIGLPSFSVSSTGGSIAVTQAGPQYWLPNLTVRLIRADGSSQFRTIDIEGARTDLQIGDAPIVAMELDPFENYLLQKRTFELTYPNTLRRAR